jgi:uncharacterized membrane protein YoaK (UPF0700 family)
MEFTYQDMIRYGFGFFNPNHAAAMIACLLPLCWGIRVFMQKRMLVFPAMAAEIILYLALIFTYSRTGFIAVLAEGAVFILLKNYLIHPEHQFRSNRFFSGRKIAVTVVILVLIVACGCGFLARCFNWIPAPDRAVTNRITLFQNGLRMLADNPRGVGSGMSGMIYTTFYQPVESSTQYRTMVNSFLTFAVENGLLGAFFAAFGFALPVAMAVILLRKHKLSSRKSIGLITGVCVLAGCVVSGMGSSCFDLNVLGGDPGFIDNFDRIMRILLLCCPVMAAVMLLCVIIAEHRRLYNHAGILLILPAVFMLSSGISLLLLDRLYKSNSGSHKILTMNGGKWLKYIPGDKQSAQNIIVIGNSNSWELKKVADFIKSNFPHDNILISLNDMAASYSVPHNGKVILCGKNYLSSEHFPDCEQYWLLPEGPPPGKYPLELKKIYLSRYDETGYNSQWKSQSTIIEEVY